MDFSPRFETEHLWLRPLGPQDAPRAAELLSPPEVREHLSLVEAPDEKTLGAMYQSSVELFRSGEAYYFALCLHGETELVGTMGIRFRQNPHHANLGYWLGRDYWGQGWMGEAVAAAQAVSFEDCFAVRCEALVKVENQGSRRVLERAGFHLDGILRRNTQRGGAWLDECFYTCLEDDWTPDQGPGVQRLRSLRDQDVES